MPLGLGRQLLPALSLAGTFAFALNGALSAIEARLDLYGVFFLSVATALTGGVVLDVLLGTPPVALRDWRYLAVAGAAAGLACAIRPRAGRLARALEVFEAAGLALFSVSGAALGVAHGLAAPQSIVLATVCATGGGMTRDVLLGEVPVVLRRGLYAVPALIGASIVVLAGAGERDILPLAAGGLACFSLRVIGMAAGVDLPRPAAREVRARAPSRPTPRPADAAARRRDGRGRARGQA